MSFIVALLLGIGYPFLLNQKLAKGLYGLKSTFWFFGLTLGAAVYVGLPAFFIYKVNIAQSDVNFGMMDALSLISMFKALTLCGLLYMHLVYIGIWNSSKNSGFWMKVLVRYCAISLLLLPIAGLIPGKTSLIFEYLAFGFGAYKSKRIVGFIFKKTRPVKLEK
ncbi:hypothetical protein ACET8Q_18405 [Aeromonas veronii]